MKRRHSEPMLLLDFSLVAPGGATTYAASFLHALASAGLGGRLSVLLPPEPHLANQEAALRRAGIGVRRSRLGLGGTWSARVGAQLSLPWEALRLRATHVFVPREVAPLLVSCRLTVLARNRLIWDRRSPKAAGRARWLFRNLAARLSVRRAGAVLAVSSTLAELLPHRARQRAHIVHHGCDVAPVTIEEKHSCRLAGHESLRVITVGVLSPHKRYDIVVDMVAELRASGIPAELEVWGPRDATGEAERLRDLAVLALGSDPLCGPLAPEHRAQLLARTDVVALGSSLESFGLPLIEAMRTSTVVVAPGSSLVDELCGECAVTYTEGSGVDAANAVLRALSALEEVARCGFARSESFSWQKTVILTVEAARGNIRG